MLEEQYDPIIDRCAGCLKVIPTQEDPTKLICKVYLSPKAKWRSSNCPMATHIRKEATKEEMMDPLKKSKRSRKKR